MLRSVKKPLRIPVPDRGAKWYGMSVYRSFILDASKKYHDFEHMKLDYDQTGAELPATAAAVRPSESGHDPAWTHVEEFNDHLEEQHEYERAFQTMEEHQRAETAEARRQNLAAYGPVRGHWTTEANRRDLENAGVPHLPATQPQPPMTRAYGSSSHVLPVAAGQIGGGAFPTFEHLNMGQPTSYRPASSAASSSNFGHRGYERLRENALGQ